MYIEKLKADFGAMDVDNSGFVTRANLQEMASQTNYILSKEELDQTIKNMDSDGDGKISIEEFVASAVRMSLA
jgi:Ca2+-binding EF-hand superfamily protein